jgi:hypothetical protein
MHFSGKVPGHMQKAFFLAIKENIQTKGDSRSIPLAINCKETPAWLPK